MLNHWPTGVRDTTEFPDLEINISTELRQHLDAMLKFEGIKWNDFEEQKDISGLDIEPQRFRSYRKLYQNLGLLYKSGEDIKLTNLGKDINELVPNLIEKKEEKLNYIAEEAIGILSKYQLNNPTESQREQLPADCDILPIVCIWKIMLSCDNKLHFEEMNRVVLRIMYMSEIDNAIHKIQEARKNIESYDQVSEEEKEKYLGLPVHTNQPAARIAAWFSFAGWGGLIIEQKVDSHGYRNLTNKYNRIIEEYISKAKYTNIENEELWYEYYSGKALINDFSIDKFNNDIENSGYIFSKNTIYRFIASLLSKKFILLTGLSGSGKTKLAEAFSYWITSNNIKNEELLFKPGLKIEADRTHYTIVGSNKLCVVIQDAQNTEIALPFSLIQQWIKTIKENDFNESTGAQIIQEKVKLEKDINLSMNNFHTPLKTLAFYIINNEKTRYNNKLKQVCFVSVGADWTNREPLLGFPNALQEGTYVRPDTGVLDLLITAEKDPLNPYFLILDEMNLSHVERYFADFLSAMESNSNIINLHSDSDEWKDSLIPPQLNLPKNLFIIGTVNIDETTYMFSPKVLDRAHVIEFRVSKNEMAAFFTNDGEANLDILVGQGSSMAQSFVETAKEFAQDDGNLKEELLPFFEKLQEAGAEFGYRTASEISTFIKKCTDLVNGKMTRDEIVDAAIMQKLLPKLHGSRNKIERILKDLGNLCLKNGTIQDFPESSIDNIKYPISYEKLQRMHKRVISDGFTSYAEA